MVGGRVPAAWEVGARGRPADQEGLYNRLSQAWQDAGDELNHGSREPVGEEVEHLRLVDLFFNDVDVRA
jgi:hypothetical protein